MRHVFDAVCFLSTDGGYFVQIPDLKGCSTEGATFDEAIENIHEAARAYIASLAEDGFSVPEYMLGNKPPEGAHLVPIEIDDTYTSPGESVTATEAARLLGVSRSRISHLLRDGKLVGHRVGRETHISLESIEDRLASEHPAGRPPGHGPRHS